MLESTLSSKLDRGKLESASVSVLRIGHRLPRDQRVTTHVCLTARALGANRVFISDTHDREIAETINRVTQRFGGGFSVEMGGSWRTIVADWRSQGGKVVHLTAYGIPLSRVIGKIRRAPGRKLVIVGAEKVPGEVFGIADWNVAVTNQPISEVSALGIFLDWFFSHKRLEDKFAKAKLEIIPTEHGKTVHQI